MTSLSLNSGDFYRFHTAKLDKMKKREGEGKIRKMEKGRALDFDYKMQKKNFFRYSSLSLLRVVVSHSRIAKSNETRIEPYNPSLV